MIWRELRQEWKEAAEKAVQKPEDSQVPLITRQTPLVWSFKTKDLEGGLGQVFEE